MGALTLKSFPFELRGWDIEKFESFDPTDSFGSNTRVYVSKDQIVLIEPEYNPNTYNTWLTDKGRQFFDGIFNISYEKESILRKFNKNFWANLFKSLTENVYILNHCNKLNFSKFYFIIVVDNLSFEIMQLLLLVKHNYPFIKLCKSDNSYSDNELESDFQLNFDLNKVKLNSSTLCLLLSSNTRYEGYFLNLNLRQRFLKGNFRCIVLGSLIDLSFPVSFAGSNAKILKPIAEGNNLLCQELRDSKNPLVIYNSELFKRSDGLNILKLLKVLNCFSTINKSWNGLNMVSSSLNENSISMLSEIPKISVKDFLNSNIFYFINVTTSSNSNFKKLAELKLMNYSLLKTNLSSKILLLDQNYIFNNNEEFLKKKVFIKSDFINYTSLPASMFYENEETFINTEGFFKRTVKLVSRKKTRNNWQIIRKIFKHLKKNLVSFEKANNDLIYFNSDKIFNFKNYMSFHLNATQSLTGLSFYLTLKNNPIYFLQKFNYFKKPTGKIRTVKLKYWLDDFFTGGRDEYSKNSLILANCSKVIRSEATNFF
jgi:Molybdopterin oxidoreductase